MHHDGSSALHEQLEKGEKSSNSEIKIHFSHDHYSKKKVAMSICPNLVIWLHSRTNPEAKRAAARPPYRMQQVLMTTD